MTSIIRAGSGASAPEPPFLRLDPASGTLWRGAEALPLRPKTLAVLRHLMERAGAVASREELREAVWGKRHGGEHGPKQCIRELRALLDDGAPTPRFIETVGRQGYRFIGDIAFVDAAERDRAGAEASQAACVGREIELAELAAGWARAQRGGRPVVLVAGETGAGKTTLVDRFVAGLDRRGDLWTATGQCAPHSGPREPYAPLLDFAGHLAAGPRGGEFVALIRSVAPTWLTQLPSVFGAREVIEKRVETTGAGPERMLRELTDVMERMTLRAPGIMVLEDLQWSDAGTLGWISAWALRRAPARLMIIGTYRSDEADSDDHGLATVLRELPRSPGYRRLELEGLSGEAVGRYLDLRFPRHAFPPSLAGALARRTEGHPIFVMALIEEWLERGVLHRDAGRWALRDEVADLAATVPPSARALIDRQVARLAPAERELLEVASAVGQDFSAAALGVGAADTEATERRCEELAARELFIRRTGSVAWPGESAAGYAFRHALYRQAIYERLPTATRSGLHRRIGARLETAFGEHARDIANVLAEHFEHAGDHRRAALYGRQAGETALRRGAARESVVQLRRALELISLCPASRERSREELLAQMTLGVALIVSDGWASPALASVYGRVRELCDELSDSEALVPALSGLWNYHLTRTEFQSVKALAARLAAFAGARTEGALRMIAHNVAGTTHWLVGEPVEAAAHIEPVLSAYDVRRHGDMSATFGEDPGIVCRKYGAIVCQLLGRSEAAERHFRDGMDIARAIHQPFGMAQILWAGAIIARERGDAALVRERALALVAVCERAQSEFWLPGGQMLAGWAAAEEGDAAGLDDIRQGLEAWQSTDTALTRPYSLALFAEACGKGGRQAEGREALSEARILAGRTGECWYAGELHRLEGELDVLAAAGPVPEAMEKFAEALRIARRQGARLLELRAAMSLVRHSSGRDRHERAHSLLAPLCGYFAADPPGPLLAEATGLLEPA